MTKTRGSLSERKLAGMFVPAGSIEDLLSFVKRHQAGNGHANYGERIAACLMSMTPEKMDNCVEDFCLKGERTAGLFTGALQFAEHSLENRLAMVRQARARFAAVARIDEAL